MSCSQATTCKQEAVYFAIAGGATSKLLFWHRHLSTFCDDDYEIIVAFEILLVTFSFVNYNDFILLVDCQMLCILAYSRMLSSAVVGIKGVLIDSKWRFEIPLPPTFCRREIGRRPSMPSVRVKELHPSLLANSEFWEAPTANSDVFWPIKQKFGKPIPLVTTINPSTAANCMKAWFLTTTGSHFIFLYLDVCPEVWSIQTYQSDDYHVLEGISISLILAWRRSMADFHRWCGTIGDPMMGLPNMVKDTPFQEDTTTTKGKDKLDGCDELFGWIRLVDSWFSWVSEKVNRNIEFTDKPRTTSPSNTSFINYNRHHYYSSSSRWRFPLHFSPVVTKERPKQLIRHLSLTDRTNGHLIPIEMSWNEVIKLRSSILDRY